MTGQYVYMRCPVPHYQQGDMRNPGTKIAAITNNLVSQNEAEQQLEMYGNLDENFANNEGLYGQDKYVLRIWHLDKDMMNQGRERVAVTRSYWKRDDLAANAKERRYGVYTFGHILTGEDIRKCFKDPGELFDSDRYETYESCSERIRASGNGRLTLDNRFALLGEVKKRPDLTIFNECGFTRETFRLYIMGILQSVSASQIRPLAVLLPEPVRKKWMSGYDSTEKLIYATYMLLPTNARVRLNCVSHWGCGIFRKQPRGMNLFFVHPTDKTATEELGELRPPKAMFLDVAGKRAVGIEAEPMPFLDYLYNIVSENWPLEHVSGMYSFIEELLGQMYWKMRPSPEICNAQYLIHKAQNVIADVFASAGNQEPHKQLDETRARVLKDTLMCSPDSLIRGNERMEGLRSFYDKAVELLTYKTGVWDPGFDEKLIVYLREPNPPLNCWERLYWSMLLRILTDPKCWEMLPQEMCSELKGPRALQAEKQLCDFFKKAYTFFENKDNSESAGNGNKLPDISDRLMKLTIETQKYCGNLDGSGLKESVDSFISLILPSLWNKGDWDSLLPMLKNYGNTILDRRSSDKSYENACRILFNAELRSEGEHKDRINELLKNAEISLMNERGERLKQFIRIFAEMLGKCLDQGVQPSASDVNRLIRFMCVENAQSGSPLAEAYDSLCICWLENKKGKPYDSTGYIKRLLQDGKYDRGAVARQAVNISRINQKNFETYVIPAELAELLAKNCTDNAKDKNEIFSFLLDYLDSAKESAWNTLMAVLKEKRLLTQFYIYSIGKNNRNLKKLKEYLPHDMASRTELLNYSMSLPNRQASVRTVQDTYWDLQGMDINQDGGSPHDQWRKLQNECTSLKKSVNWSNQAAAAPYYNNLSKFALKLLDKYSIEDICELDEDEAKFIDQVIHLISDNRDDLVGLKTSKGAQAIDFVKRTDHFIRDCCAEILTSKELEIFCTELNDFILRAINDPLQRVVRGLRLNRAICKHSAFKAPKNGQLSVMKNVIAIQLCRLESHGNTFDIGHYLNLLGIPDSRNERREETVDNYSKTLKHASDWANSQLDIEGNQHMLEASSGQAAQPRNQGQSCAKAQLEAILGLYLMAGYVGGNYKKIIEAAADESLKKMFQKYPQKEFADVESPDRFSKELDDLIDQALQKRGQDIHSLLKGSGLRYKCDPASYPVKREKSSSDNNATPRVQPEKERSPGFYMEPDDLLIALVCFTGTAGFIGALYALFHCLHLM